MFCSGGDSPEGAKPKVITNFAEDITRAGGSALCAHRPGRDRTQEGSPVRGRRKTYETPEALEEAVAQYFDSISVMETVTESVPTGRLDKYGHEIMQRVEVKNVFGKPFVVRRFLHQPEVYSMTAHFGISMATWERYG